MAATQRWALGVEYLGAAYCGWQRQLEQPSLQAAVESALSAIAASPINVTAAGRTDTGVHASLQIIHFETTVEREATSWVRGGNQHLPSDVAIRWAQPVDNDFHARFSALSRRYVYLRSPIVRGYTRRASAGPIGRRSLRALKPRCPRCWVRTISALFARRNAKPNRR
jgi:tRNA pseudouridine(38-40) synthase